MPNLAGLKPFHRLCDVALIHNRVSLEDTAGLPTTNFLDHALCNSSTSQITCRASSQVVEQQVRHTSLLTDALPSPPEVQHALAVLSREDVIIWAFIVNAFL